MRRQSHRFSASEGNCAQALRGRKFVAHCSSSSPQQAPLSRRFFLGISVQAVFRGTAGRRHRYRNGNEIRRTAVLKRMLIASASLALMGGAAHAQANTSKTPYMTVIPGQLNTMTPPSPHKRHKTTPTETTPPETATQATTKTPSPPDQNPTPPPDQIKTAPDAASPGGRAFAADARTGAHAPIGAATTAAAA